MVPKSLGANICLKDRCPPLKPFSGQDVYPAIEPAMWYHVSQSNPHYVDACDSDHDKSCAPLFHDDSLHKCGFHVEFFALCFERPSPQPPSIMTVHFYYFDPVHYCADVLPTKDWIDDIISPGCANGLILIEWLEHNIFKNFIYSSFAHSNNYWVKMEHVVHEKERKEHSGEQLDQLYSICTFLEKISS